MFEIFLSRLPDWNTWEIQPYYRNLRGRKIRDSGNRASLHSHMITSSTVLRSWLTLQYQLAGYFDKHNLLCKSQAGFRKRHPTETAVAYFTDEVPRNEYGQGPGYRFCVYQFGG